MSKDLAANGEIVLSGDVVGDEWTWAFGQDDAFIAPGDVRAALAKAGDGPITVRLNSFGGHVHAGEQVRAMFAAHPGEVTMIVEGAAYSAATLILMGAGRREMTEGSTLMIHDPSSIVMGTEADMLKAAQATGTIAQAAAAVYASASGKTAEECRAIMKEEVWYDAPAALEAGWVHAMTANPTMSGGSLPPGNPKAAFAAAQKALQARLMKSAEERQPADTATLEGDSTMEKTPAAIEAEKIAAANMAADAVTTALSAERGRVKTIREMAAPFVASGQLPDAEVVAMIDGGTSAEAASGAILAKMAATAPTHRPAQIMADVVDRTKMGMTKALYAKVGLKDGERNEFSSMSLSEMARVAIQTRNERPQSGRLEMIGQAFTMAGVGHSTSDFGSLLADVANKSMLKGWDEAQETYEAWTSKGSATDFKTVKRVGVTPFPSLDLVVEGGEFTYATIADFAEPVTLATYGKLFQLDRQLVINDDLNALSKIPMSMGRAAKRTIGTLAYSVLTANAAMADTVALFHATHANLGTAGAPSEATINAGVTAMWTQRDRSLNAVALNIQPEYILAPISLRAVILQALNSEYAPDDTSKAGTTKQPYAYNTVKGVVKPIFDARLTGTAWYLAANPTQFDGVEISYLDGNETPFMDEMGGWKTDGIEYKVRIDAVAKALTWESLFKNAG